VDTEGFPGTIGVGDKMTQLTTEIIGLVIIVLGYGSVIGIILFAHRERKKRLARIFANIRSRKKTFKIVER